MLVPRITGTRTLLRRRSLTCIRSRSCRNWPGPTESRRRRRSRRTGDLAPRAAEGAHSGRGRAEAWAIESHLSRWTTQLRVLVEPLGRTTDRVRSRLDADVPRENRDRALLRRGGQHTCFLPVTQHDRFFAQQPALPQHRELLRLQHVLPHSSSPGRQRLQMPRAGLTQCHFGGHTCLHHTGPGPADNGARTRPR